MKHHFVGIRNRGSQKRGFQNRVSFCAGLRNRRLKNRGCENRGSGRSGEALQNSFLVPSRGFLVPSRDCSVEKKVFPSYPNFPSNLLPNSVMAQIRFVKSQKGSNLVALDGYLYRKESTQANTFNWRCVDDKKFHCKARLITPQWHDALSSIDDVVKRGTHSHPPDPAKIGKKELQAVVKERAVTTNEPPRAIVQAALVQVGEEVAARCRSNENLANTVRRKRRADEAFPPPPIHRHGFDIPPALGQRLLVDTGREDHQRILIFGDIERLARHDSWFQDGTFKVAPEILYQAYTIHVAVRSSVIPSIYALLPNKTRHTYDRMWSEIKNLHAGLNPRRIMSDFEKAAIDSVKTALPNVSVTGCYFHLGQSLWRKVQDLGHREQYVEDEEFRLKCKSLLALAFLPPDEVIDAFEELDDEGLEEVYNYFEDTYIGRLRRRGRATPLFPIPLWNMLERQEYQQARTNNAIEGWHRAFQGSLQVSHPTLWRYIEAIQREMAFQTARYNQIRAGNSPDRKHKEYEQVNRRIARKMQEYRNEEISRPEFLRGISHNVEINV